MLIKNWSIINIDTRQVPIINYLIYDSGTFEFQARKAVIKNPGHENVRCVIDG